MNATKHGLRLVLAAAASMALSSAAVAQTADGTPPAQEDVCSGFSGRAYGLCNAYCEAQDCDSLAQETPSCQNVRRAFERSTGSTLPCQRAETTSTPTSTATDTPTPTNTPEEATETPTGTPTGTAAATATDTPEPTATDTPEPTATDTPEPPATDTPTGTPTGTAAGTIG
jgi:hypothetical protein